MPGPSLAATNGLNWQGHVPPYTLSMTSLPPTLPVLPAVDEDADELLDEPPPQAANDAHTAIKEMSQLKRFIDALRSPRWFHHSSQDVAGSKLRAPQHPTTPDRCRPTELDLRDTIR